MVAPVPNHFTNDAEQAAKNPDLEFVPESAHLLCEASAKAYALQKELKERDVVPETQAAREALEVSIELLLHKARLEYERRQRAYAEMLEHEQEMEAQRLAEEQLRAADMADLHRKEVELKRVRAISQKEKKRLHSERQILEEAFEDERAIKEQEDREMEGKINLEYKRRKQASDIKITEWKDKQALKVEKLKEELQFQVDAAKVELEKEVEEYGEKELDMKQQEEEAAQQHMDALHAHNQAVLDLEMTTKNHGEAEKNQKLTSEEHEQLEISTLSAKREADDAQKTAELEVEERDRNYRSEVEAWEKEHESEVAAEQHRLEMLQEEARTKIENRRMQQEAASALHMQEINDAQHEHTGKQNEHAAAVSKLEADRQSLADQEAEGMAQKEADLEKLRLEEREMERRIGEKVSELEGQIAADLAQVEKEMLEDTDKAEQERVAMEGRISTRGELQAAQEGALQADKQALRSVEERLKQERAATEQLRADHSDKVASLSGELESRSMERLAKERADFDVMSKHRKIVDEREAILHKAQEDGVKTYEQMLEDQRMEGLRIDQEEKARGDSVASKREEAEQAARDGIHAAKEALEAEKTRISNANGRLEYEIYNREKIEKDQREELDNAMGAAVELHEMLERDEIKAKGDKKSKDEAFAAELAQLSEEETQMRRELQEKEAAVEEGVRMQIAALEEEAGTMRKVLEERKLALDQVVTTVEHEHEKQLRLLEKVEKNAAREMKNLKSCEADWRQGVTSNNEIMLDPENTKMRTSEYLMRKLSFELRLVPIELEIPMRPVHTAHHKIEADLAGRHVEIDAETAFITAEEARVSEMVEIRRRALEEAARIERQRLVHEQSARQALVDRRRAAIEARKARLEAEHGELWGMLSSIRQQVDDTLAFQRKSEEDFLHEVRNKDKDHAKRGRQLEIARRTSVEEFEKRLEAVEDARISAQKALDEVAAADAVEMQKQREALKVQVTDDGDAKHQQALREKELGDAVREAAEEMAAIQKVISDARRQWEDRDLPALQAALYSAQDEAADMEKDRGTLHRDLEDEIKFRTEETEAAHTECAAALRERQGADAKDRQGHTALLEEHRVRHEDRVEANDRRRERHQVLHEENVADLHAQQKALQEELQNQDNDRLAEYRRLRGLCEDQQRDCDARKAAIFQEQTRLDRERDKHAGNKAAAKAEEEALHAEANAEHQTRRQAASKKKVVAYEALQNRKVAKLAELRQMKDNIVEEAAKAKQEHEEAMARVNELRRRAVDAAEHLHTMQKDMASKKATLNQRESDLGAKKHTAEEKLPLMRKRSENVHLREKKRLEKELVDLEEEYESNTKALEKEMQDAVAKMEKDTQDVLDALRAKYTEELSVRRDQVNGELETKRQALQSELDEYTGSEQQAEQEEAEAVREVERRAAKRAEETRKRAEARAAAREIAKDAHMQEKRAFGLEMNVMGEQLDNELEEFETQEVAFEAQIKKRKMAELEEETRRMQEAMDAEKKRMREELEEAQRMAKARMEAERRARLKAQKKLEREAERLRRKMEMEAAAEKARLQAEMAQMEAERLTLLAGHSSDESSDDDELNSMHIDLQSIQAQIPSMPGSFAAGGSAPSSRPISQQPGGGGGPLDVPDAPEAVGAEAGAMGSEAPSGSGPGGAAQDDIAKPSPRVAGLRDKVALAQSVQEEDLEAIKAKELAAFEEEKRKMMEEIARMEEEARALEQGGLSD
ncbi:hypothetical protein CYMTET_55514 [Cymbomonas tetramitiformis]|uniref:Uncharacterized protein n=1 Tax=Cymbomonas tetramitiformis TaxID=36881 RepID=A0AAE0BE07_9CHLO|nr:hypothetical protein CYMTET_55514 [Cymbomonas tetramitiformis]